MVAWGSFLPDCQGWAYPPPPYPHKPHPSRSKRSNDPLPTPVLGNRPRAPNTIQMAPNLKLLFNQPLRRCLIGSPTPQEGAHCAPTPLPALVELNAPPSAPISMEQRPGVLRYGVLLEALAHSACTHSCLFRRVCSSGCARDMCVCVSLAVCVCLSRRRMGGGSSDMFGNQHFSTTSTRLVGPRNVSPLDPFLSEVGRRRPQRITP